MDLTHRFSVPVSVEQAWRALNDLELLDQCFPGLTIDGVAGDAFTGSIKVKLGPIGLVYAGSGRYVERDSDVHRVVLESHGADRRGQGTADARLVATLTGNGDSTDIDLSTDLTVTGKPAQFGDGVIADVSDKLMAQFASCAASRLAEGFESPRVRTLRPAALATAEHVPALDAEAATEPGPDAATDDAGAHEAAEPGGAPEDAEMVQEISESGTVEEIEETVELGAVPEEIDGPAEPEAVAEIPAPPPLAEQPVNPPPPPPRPYRYTPPTDLSEPHARTLGTAVTTLLRRHGPGLGVGFLAAVVVIKIINRVRNR
jgi:carbon monoxide dehydrogenase subunit G